MPTGLRCIVAMIVTLLFSGCVSVGSTPVRMLPVGSKVQVNQELSAVGGARISIQYGRVMPRRQITLVDPHCQFYLYRSQEEMRDPVVVKPGVFTVKRTFQRRDYAWAEGLQLAFFTASGDGDPTRHPTTIMELSSDEQPEVKDLRCAIWGTTYIEGYLTIEQMQATLGDLVKLIVVTDSG
ncbi:MAG: hypothetical protein QNI91_17140 [Arenicellales bacterium]|nr:hypothetical protein [Arenicellales bacterium]